MLQQQPKDLGFPMEIHQFVSKTRPVKILVSKSIWREKIGPNRLEIIFLINSNDIFQLLNKLRHLEKRSMIVFVEYWRRAFLVFFLFAFHEDETQIPIALFSSEKKIYVESEKQEKVALRFSTR